MDLTTTDEATLVVGAANHDWVQAAVKHCMFVLSHRHVCEVTAPYLYRQITMLFVPPPATSHGRWVR